MQRKTITLLILVTILVSLACNFSVPTPTPEQTPIILPYPATACYHHLRFLQTQSRQLPEVTDTSQPSVEIGPLNELNWFSINLPPCVASSAQSTVVAEVLAIRSVARLGDLSTT